MKGLLAVMLFLHLVPYIRGYCFQNNSTCKQNTLSMEGVNCKVLILSEFDQCTTVEKLILSNNNISLIDGKLGANFKNLKHLDLSCNKLERLPEDFLSGAKKLMKLSLKSNQFSELPEDFFSFTTELQTLNLELNPIIAVPPTIINTNLVNLTVDCRCDLIQSIVERFAKGRSNGTLINHNKEMFKCKMTNDWLGISNFYKDHCKSSGLLAVYICVPLVAVGILAGVAIYVFARKKRKATDLPSKVDSDMSPTHKPTRYTTRNKENVSNNIENKMPSQTKAYENIFVGPMQSSPGPPAGHYECLDRTKDPRSHAVEEDYYMQSDADQPIYGNTEQMYYNFSAAQNPTDDDVYIMPDT